MPIEFRTPGTNLWWSNLEEWNRAAFQIDHRRLSSARHEALRAHAAALPRSVVNAETKIENIDGALQLLKYGPTNLARPNRGQRANAPQTAIIEDLMNRRAVLQRELDIVPGQNWLSAHPDQRAP